MPFTVALTLRAWKVDGLSGGHSVPYFLLPFPLSVRVPSFYSAIALNEELLKKNKTLAKFPKCFTANIGATQCECALKKHSSSVCCFHVFLIKNLREDCSYRLSFWSSTRAFSRSWCRRRSREQWSCTRATGVK